MEALQQVLYNSGAGSVDSAALGREIVETSKRTVHQSISSPSVLFFGILRAVLRLLADRRGRGVHARHCTATGAATGYRVQIEFLPGAN